MFFHGWGEIDEVLSIRIDKKSEQTQLNKDFVYTCVYLFNPQF